MTLFSSELSVPGSWTGMTTKLATRRANGLSGERGGMSSKLDMRRSCFVGCLLPDGVVGILRVRSASDWERTRTACGFEGSAVEGRGGVGDVGEDGGGEGGGECGGESSGDE